MWCELEFLILFYETRTKRYQSRYVCCIHSKTPPANRRNYGRNCKKYSNERTHTSTWNKDYDGRKKSGKGSRDFGRLKRGNVMKIKLVRSILYTK